ncbi:MAG TPA: paraquat-inducible protein A [Opitutaceae bacterium]|nr:paraquat-inducible protein A [Opitutaceae bacterium]
MLPSQTPLSFPAAPVRLTCRLCGCGHDTIALARGERASCARCGALLAARSRFDTDAPLAFALTGLLLAYPAFTLPLVKVAKFGSARDGLVLTGVAALWRHDMRLLAVWVLFCGALAPLALLVVLGGLLAPSRFALPWRTGASWWRAARALDHWAMPEVQVLAVLVALFKLGRLVNVSLQTGFWCYAAMAAMILLAWRTCEFAPRPAADVRAGKLT